MARDSEKNNQAQVQPHGNQGQTSRVLPQIGPANQDAPHEENYNIKRAIRVHELDQWFKGTFGYWPANPKEPILVDIGKASQLLEYVREVSMFRGHPVCGFDVEKINQDKDVALFK
uniref:Uncharacterized protein n=1 Tax=Romanomermis culicivorax TaxID=13658 RepID=A0A915HWS3_ROMCU